MRFIGYVFLVAGLIFLGGAIAKIPIDASGAFYLGYFMPSGLITFVGVVLLVLASKSGQRP